MPAVLTPTATQSLQAHAQPPAATTLSSTAQTPAGGEQCQPAEDECEVICPSCTMINDITRALCRGCKGSLVDAELL
jgi:hypothetical protein